MRLISRDTLLTTVWMILLPTLAKAIVSSPATGKPAALREFCQFHLVETIPASLNYGASQRDLAGSIFEAILEMINEAKRTIKIASWYIALTPPDSAHNLDSKLTRPGERILEALEAAAKRGIKLEIVVGKRQTHDDIKRLYQIAKVHYLDHDDNLGLESEMNSKFIIVDDENFYLGSSDFVWFAFTMNKSFGIVFRKCKSLAKDLNKIFQTYVVLAGMSPGDKIPDRLHTALNLENPMNISVPETLNYHTYRMFFGNSPAITTEQTGRTSDLDALMHVIDSAREFIYISVPEYAERYCYTEPRDYWSVISDGLKRAAMVRGVKIKLLFDEAKSGRGDRMMWYRSLAAIGKVDSGHISVYMFKMPAVPSPASEEVRFARIKMDKYMVTDRGLYLGTSSWTPDFFNKYAGTGLVIKPTTLAHRDLIVQAEKIFLRDYNSRHSYPIPL